MTQNSLMRLNKIALVTIILKLQEENERLKEDKKKATEYIKEHIIEDSEYDNYMQCEREEKNELLDILKGSDNNE